MNVRELDFLTLREKDILIKNKIKTLEELLYFFPFRFEEAPRAKQIQDLKVGDIVTISGVVVDIEAKTGFKSGAKYTKALIEDNTDTIQAIWWNMPFVAKTIFPEQKIILTGTVAERDGDLYLNNPKVEKVKTWSINADSTLFQSEEKKPQTGIYTNFRNDKGTLGPWTKNFYIVLIPVLAIVVVVKSQPLCSCKFA